MTERTVGTMGGAIAAMAACCLFLLGSGIGAQRGSENELVMANIDVQPRQ